MKAKKKETKKKSKKQLSKETKKAQRNKQTKKQGNKISSCLRQVPPLGLGLQGERAIWQCGEMGAKLAPNSIPNRPKMVQKKIQNPSKIDLGGSWRVLEGLGGHVVYKSQVGYEKDGSLVHFWAPSWSPSWSHVGSKTDTKITPKSNRILYRILGRLGPVLEAILGPC